MVAQASAANSRNLWFRGRSFAARRTLVSTKADKRVPCKLGIAFRHFAQQFEEQGQGTRRMFHVPFMLRCNRIR